MEIAILCSVVDNYGDIGFVYRLSRNISQMTKDYHLSLIVSNLSSFASMAPAIDVNKAIQEYNGWTVLDWNNAQVCTEYYKTHKLQIVLQCFQCGRPDWMEDLLFAKDRTETVQVINVEYLTAEEWADDFHLLKSGTRSAYVKKINFMPGFTDKTAGLVLDEPFMSYLSDSQKALNQLDFYKTLKQDSQNTFDVLLFSYPRDFVPIIKSLKMFEQLKKQQTPDFKVRLLAAAGISQKSVLEANQQEGNPFEVIKLPYLSQIQWDALLTLTDFNFIRGEDSFSRASLSGIPFIWHAYPQDEEYQIVKVDAFTKRLCKYLNKQDADNISRFYLCYNRIYDKIPDEESQKVLALYDNLEEYSKSQDLFLQILLDYDRLKAGFKEFSKHLIDNGNLTENLLAYINSL